MPITSQVSVIGPNGGESSKKINQLIFDIIFVINTRSDHERSLIIVDILHKIPIKFIFISLQRFRQSYRRYEVGFSQNIDSK